VARQSASTFSELKGATPFIERQLDPFFKIGEQVLQAAADGRLDEARNLSLEFRKTEAAFGPDTAALREKLAMLTSAVGSAALSSQSIIQDLDLILFALAGCLGIGAGVFVSAHIVRALRRLAEGTAAVQPVILRSRYLSKPMMRSGSSLLPLIEWSKKSAPEKK
jgi:hypothetical protein